MATSTSSLATATPSNERCKEQEKRDRDAIMKWIDAITNDFPASNDEQQSSDTQSDATSFDSYCHLSLLDGGPGPVTTCQFEDDEGDDLPLWLLNLHLKLRRVIKDRRIPQEVREKIDVKKHFANTPLDEVDCYFSSTKRSPLAKLDMDSELKQVLTIVETAWDFDRLNCTNRDEWDAQVNGPMLQLLEGYFEDFRIGAVQEQCAQPEYLPTYNGKQIEYKERGINFAIVWTLTQDEEARIWSALGPGCSINHSTTDKSLSSQPMIIPIAAQMQQHYDNLDDACVPLALWAMSQFKRLREISGRDWCSFPTPMLQVYGAQWHLLFAVDGPALEVFSCGPIGSTTTLTQIYKLLGSLRVVMEWVSDTYLPMFKDEVLRRLVPREYEEDSMDLSRKLIIVRVPGAQAVEMKMGIEAISTEHMSYPKRRYSRQHTT